jgi:hypothetical protein
MTMQRIGISPFSLQVEMEVATISAGAPCSLPLRRTWGGQIDTDFQIFLRYPFSLMGRRNWH